MATVWTAAVRLARRQYWVVARWQLIQLGLSEAAIEHRLATGRLHRIHRGVYALGRRDVPLRGKWLAAVLACGEGALLSHTSAGALWGLVRARARAFHVTSDEKRGRDDPGISLHRTRSLPACDRALRDRIPVTSLPRTLVDVAGVLDADQLRDAFEEADRLRLLELREVADACDRARGRRGVGTLRALVAEAAEPAYMRSHFERRFRHFCREQALPRPETSVHVEGFEVDALWRRERVVVELDSWDFHGRTRAAFERDRARDAKLGLVGYRVYRLTWRRLEDQTAEVARELRAYLATPVAARGA